MVRPWFNVLLITIFSFSLLAALISQIGCNINGKTKVYKITVLDPDLRTPPNTAINNVYIANDVWVSGCCVRFAGGNFDIRLCNIKVIIEEID